MSISYSLSAEAIQYNPAYGNAFLNHSVPKLVIAALHLHYGWIYNSTNITVLHHTPNRNVVLCGWIFFNNNISFSCFHSHAGKVYQSSLKTRIIPTWESIWFRLRLYISTLMFKLYKCVFLSLIYWFLHYVELSIASCSRTRTKHIKKGTPKIYLLRLLRDHFQTTILLTFKTHVGAANWNWWSKITRFPLCKIHVYSHSLVLLPPTPLVDSAKVFNENPKNAQASSISYIFIYSIFTVFMYIKVHAQMLK